MTIQTVTDAIRYVGVDDNTLALFENWFGCRTLQRSMVRCAGRRLAMKKLLQS